jgi:hypothetical protein
MLFFKPLEKFPGTFEAQIGDYYKGDGVRFYLQIQQTCYRRGVFSLFIEVADEHHEKWGCFDEADQPMRYYHNYNCMFEEASSIAAVFLKDRQIHGPLLFGDLNMQSAIDCILKN